MPLLDQQFPLDPALMDWMAKRKGLPAPVAEPPAAPPVAPPVLDPEVMGLLEQSDAQAQDQNAKQDLREGVARSMNYFLGRPVNPEMGPPKVDDAVKRYIINRKMGAQHPADPLVPLRVQEMMAKLAGQARENEVAPPEWGAAPGMNRAEALRAGYGHAPKVDDGKIPKIPITDSNAKALSARGIDPSGMDNSEAARLLGTQLIGGGGLDVRKGEIERDKTGDLRMGRYMELGPKSPLIGDAGGKSKFIDGAEAAIDTANNAEKLRGLIKKYGQGRNVPEAARTQMKQLVANLRTSLKTIMQLGVIAGPDMPQFVDPQIADPTLIEANFNKFFGEMGKTDYDTQLRGLTHNFLGKTKRKMDLLDVVPTGPLLRQFAKARADELFMAGKSAAEIEKTLEAEGY